MKIRLTIISLLISLCTSAQDSKFPKETYNQFKVGINKLIRNDSIIIEVQNPIKAPIRFNFKTSSFSINTKHKLNNYIVLPPLEKKNNQLSIYS